MKLLIIANNTIVFGKELRDELVAKNLDVSLLDFESLVLFEKNVTENKSYNNKFMKYKNISKVSMIFRMYYIKKIIQENNFDIVNIHFSRWFYLAILETLSKTKLIITFYGSDFYRTSNFIKDIQKRIYKKADKITFTNPSTKDSFLNYYNDFTHKSYICRFGLKTIDFIDKNREIPKSKIKEILGFSQNKIIITCGYNSTKAQQHNKMIQSIITLPSEIKDKLQVVFPLTYGDKSNKEEIKTKLKDTDLDFIILEDFLYEDNNAYIKLASDIMINILQTDSFSGTMQEFLYAKNIVITGEWLPYELFDKEGINYHKVKHTDMLCEKLEDIIQNIDSYKIDLDQNIKIIYNLSSWKNNIKSWKDIYEN